jgi:hypothetical protein
MGDRSSKAAGESDQDVTVRQLCKGAEVGAVVGRALVVVVPDTELAGSDKPCATGGVGPDRHGKFFGGEGRASGETIKLGRAWHDEWSRRQAFGLHPSREPGSLAHGFRQRQKDERVRHHFVTDSICRAFREQSRSFKDELTCRTLAGRAPHNDAVATTVKGDRRSERLFERILAIEDALGGNRRPGEQLSQSTGSKVALLARCARTGRNLQEALEANPFRCIRRFQLKRRCGTQKRVPFSTDLCREFDQGLWEERLATATQLASLLGLFRTRPGLGDNSEPRLIYVVEAVDRQFDERKQLRDSGRGVLFESPRAHARASDSYPRRDAAGDRRESHGPKKSGYRSLPSKRRRGAVANTDGRTE